MAFVAKVRVSTAPASQAETPENRPRYREHPQNAASLIVLIDFHAHEAPRGEPLAVRAGQFRRVADVGAPGPVPQDAVERVVVRMIKFLEVLLQTPFSPV